MQHVNLQSKSPVMERLSLLKCELCMHGGRAGTSCLGASNAGVN